MSKYKIAEIAIELKEDGTPIDYILEEIRREE
jgi:hypothetical protein